MKRPLLIAIFVLAATLPAFGADPVLQQGMRLYQQHHYNEAARLLYQNLNKAGSNAQPALQLSFGMACLANARCYAQLYQTALSIQHDYLKRLVTNKKNDKTASRLAALFMGKAHMASGDLKAAATWLKRFLAKPKTADSAKADARIALGIVYYRLGDLKRAQNIWSKVQAKTPEAHALKAAAYQRAGLDKMQPLQMADTAMAKWTSTGKALSIQSATALLDVYIQTNQTAKGFKVLNGTDLKAAAYEEVLSTYKTIDFYDPALLDRLAAFYNLVAVKTLKKVGLSSDTRARTAATFYLGEAYNQMGKPKQALDAVRQFLARNPKPKSVKEKAQVRQAFLQMQLNPKSDPAASLKAFNVTKAGAAMVSDILMGCSTQQVNCPAAIERTTTLWQQSPGRAPVNLSSALGRHFLQQGHYHKALIHLEGGRDKSRKNRIETNPPLMLIDLARAYYHVKQFSEALEIYFEMSKQFPAVRQIQVALQGVYAMEEQSAGDAKIF